MTDRRGSQNLQPTLFYTADGIGTRSTLDVSDVGLKSASIISGMSENEKLSFFEVNDTAAWIKSNNYQRIALQFPDSLLCCSSFVVEHLMEATPAKFFVLADTSYGREIHQEILAVRTIQYN
ncbi:hypothetical protein AB6A40_003369 [Gnathostoma spinigerum]|uniref:Uncharacterized protein n=1 Tax=Gnathostoma spinigerum TaxID=75299 RepID=A0ABD6EAJ8_9BILA